MFNTFNLLKLSWKTYYHVENINIWMLLKWISIKFIINNHKNAFVLEFTSHFIVSKFNPFRYNRLNVAILQTKMLQSRDNKHQGNNNEKKYALDYGKSAIHFEMLKICFVGFSAFAIGSFTSVVQYSETRGKSGRNTHERISFDGPLCEWTIWVNVNECHQIISA